MKHKTIQGIIYFTTVSVPFLLFLYNQLWIPSIVFGFFIFMGIMVILFPNSNMNVKYEEFYDTRHGPRLQALAKADCLTYYGDQLDFSNDDIILILNRHSSFYSTLDDADKKKFLKRMIAFIDDKTLKYTIKAVFVKCQY